MTERQIVWQDHKINREDRQSLNGHRSFVLWFTGLSGSGKSTLAGALESHLHQRGIRTYLLDGDNVRHGLNKDLGFSDQDRKENIRRLGEVCKLFVDAGVVTLTAFISPFQAERELARELVGKEHFIEIFVRCPLEVCEKRDVKGLYEKARKGLIPQFTGISSPYEEPAAPSLIVDTAQTSVADAVEKMAQLLVEKGFLKHE